ncbi:MAG: PaaI family thioesterase [Chloroflexota bacterium]|nr:PaaI family thioesterase [Chloroflexota bacterium]
MTAAPEPRWPADPIEAVAAHWQQEPFFALFKVAVEALDEGYARIGVDRDDMPLRGVRDSINGGVVGSLGEAAARLCLTTQLAPEERLGATHEVSVSYLTSARGEHTTAEARLLRRGRRIAVADVELRDTTDGAINAKIRVSMGIERTESPS